MKTRSVLYSVEANGASILIKRNTCRIIRNNHNGMHRRIRSKEAITEISWWEVKTHFFSGTFMLVNSIASIPLRADDEKEDKTQVYYVTDLVTCHKRRSQLVLCWPQESQLWGIMKTPSLELHQKINSIRVQIISLNGHRSGNVKKKKLEP